MHVVYDECALCGNRFYGEGNIQRCLQDISTADGTETVKFCDQCIKKQKIKRVKENKFNSDPDIHHKQQMEEDAIIRAAVEKSLYDAGIIEDPDIDGGLLG